MNASVAGLNANATRLSTISDNIANSGTHGYKCAEADFHAMVIGSTAGTYSAGGVRTTTTRMIDESGALATTNNATDLAVRGRGFIPVMKQTDLISATDDWPMYMTTTGSFRTDEDGYLRTTSGQVLLGWPATADGTIPNYPRDTIEGLVPVQIANNQFAAEPTTEMTIGVNLPAVETSADADGDFLSLSVEYFDNLGTSQNLDISYSPVIPPEGSPGSNLWTVVLRDSGKDGEVVGSYVIEFNASQTNGGTIENVTQVAMDPEGKVAVPAVDSSGNHLSDVAYYDSTPNAATPTWTMVEAAGDNEVFLYTGFTYSDADHLWDSTHYAPAYDSTGNPIVDDNGDPTYYLTTGNRPTTADPAQAAAYGNTTTNEIPYGEQWDTDATYAAYGSASDSDVVGSVYDPATGLLTIQVGPLDDSITIDIGAQHSGSVMTQLSDSFAPTTINKDGFPVGNMTSIEVDGNGFVSANFDTGITRTLYQIPIVDVSNPNGLTSLDNQMYTTSDQSGSFFLWDAGDGPTGDVVSFALEESATDVAAELTALIQTQRAYSSNAKVIQTVDEMLQETTNIKR
nr:flagellar hook-basal body complex protein [Rhodovulum sp. P5]